MDASKSRKIKGLSIVVCLTMLALAFVIHRFSENKRYLPSLSGNLRTLQIAVESYASDTGGAYPVQMKDKMHSGTAGMKETNPKNNILDLDPMQNVEQLRLWAMEHRASLKANQTIYTQLDNGNSYAIAGTDAAGTVYTNGNGRVLILSNQ